MTHKQYRRAYVSLLHYGMLFPLRPSPHVPARSPLPYLVPAAYFLQYLTRFGRCLTARHLHKTPRPAGPGWLACAGLLPSLQTPN